MVLKTSVLVFGIISSIFGGDVDLDYIYGSGLRSETTLKCNSRLRQFVCQLKCDMKPALCIEDACYCMSIAPPSYTKPEVHSKVLLNNNNSKRNRPAVLPYTKKSVGKTNLGFPEIELDLNYALRPTVRHHIAHFCPNLEVARACIRKCMVQGKPAFCGKDHVCYCGHKYTHTDKDDGGDAEVIYAQFKDLYDKYFGPDYKANFETLL